MADGNSNNKKREKELFHKSFKNVLLDKLGIHDGNNLSTSFDKKEQSTILLQLEVENNDQLHKLFGKFKKPYNIIRSFFGEFF